MNKTYTSMNNFISDMHACNCNDILLYIQKSIRALHVYRLKHYLAFFYKEIILNACKNKNITFNWLIL